MKYLLLCALLFCGAFFSSSTKSQDVELPVEYECLEGGLYEFHDTLGHICSAETSAGEEYYFYKNVGGPWRRNLGDACLGYGNVAYNRWLETRQNFDYTAQSHNTSLSGTTCNSIISFTLINNAGNPASGTIDNSTSNYRTRSVPAMCPPNNQPFLVNSHEINSTTLLCWIEATVVVDEEPGCDDIVGNCEPDPECVEGGGGMLVCKADPDEKCAEDAFGQLQCEEGCGFVNEDFFCLTEPDGVPNFEKCEFTLTGYACPSAPNDNVTNPDTPIDEMKKSDFKDVNIGVESRQNVTNDLLETQLAADAAHTGEIKDAINGMNQNLGEKLEGIGGHLAGIGDTLDGINDSLNPEDTRPIGLPESWYTPVYEDGISGVWNQHRSALDQTPLFTFLDQFSFAPSGTQPDWNMCFNLGALGNYGCERLEVPAFIWNFIRIVMLLGSAFTARRLVFGG